MTVTRDWLLALQSRILTALEAQDTLTFRREPWTRDGDPLTGDGLTCVLEEGSFYERGAVNFSDITGPRMPAAATQKHPEVAGRPFRAMGVSLVLHPRNPRVPTVHMNVRSLGTMDGEVQWFGGGFDLTPYYPVLEDVLHWHQTAKAACEPFGPEVYPALKAAADAYFFLPHRGETRGVGGLFAEDHDNGALIRSIGDHFLDAWLPIADRRGGEPYGERERAFQLLRRGRYVEFNLVFDRGTHFGLHGGGRTESILVSMPPLASWRYDARFEAGSEEAGLGEWLRGRDWLG